MAVRENKCETNPIKKPNSELISECLPVLVTSRSDEVLIKSKFFCPVRGQLRAI